MDFSLTISWLQHLLMEAKNDAGWISTVHYGVRIDLRRKMIRASGTPQSKNHEVIAGFYSPVEAVHQSDGSPRFSVPNFAQQVLNEVVSHAVRLGPVLYLHVPLLEISVSIVSKIRNSGELYPTPEDRF